MKLSDHAEDWFTQSGDDGMIQHCINLMTPQSRFCVEFGASDGTSCSNTLRLRLGGWEALLIEENDDLFKRLESDHLSEQVTCIHDRVTPDNIDTLITAVSPDSSVDFMSIDVDGDDYAIFAAMQTRPRLVVIEYNASVPPHISLRQSQLGDNFGASAKALCDLAMSKNYRLVGMTKANLYFVVADEAVKFEEYETNLDQIFDQEWLTYLATDYHGHPVLTGGTPHWGLRAEPCLFPLEGQTQLAIPRPSAIRDGIEERYGTVIYIGQGMQPVAVLVPSDHLRTRLSIFMESAIPIVFDVSNHAPDTRFFWIEKVAARANWKVERWPGVAIALIPPNGDC